MSMKKKGRGPAKLPDKWGSGVKIELTLNEEGQVVGIQREYNDYRSALGAFSRVGTLLPLNYTSWYHMPKDKLDIIWQDVQANTTLPSEARKTVLHQLNDMWRDWKHRVKADYFTPYIGDPNHDFSQLPTDEVELDQWLILVKYWQHEEVQKQAKKNAKARAQKKYPHRTGKTPFQLLKAKMQMEGKDTMQLDMFFASRLCGNGIEADHETMNLIKACEEVLSRKHESEHTKEFKQDLFVNTFGEDPHGRVRCMGRGVTHTKLRNVDASNAPTTQMTGEIAELRRLKDELTREKKEIELMKQELSNQREEFSKEKEHVVHEVRREFREELDHMKLSLDFFVSLVKPSTVQAALSQVRKNGEKTSVPLDHAREPQASANGKTTDFATPQKLAHEKHSDTPTQANKPLPYFVNLENTMPGTTFDCPSIQVGSDVILYCSNIPKERVAEGVLLSMDPNKKIEELALGHEFVKVVIKKAIKPDYFLVRPRRGISTVPEAVGKSVAWEYIDVMEK